MANPREYGPLDFEITGADDGYNDVDAIDPVTNGEDANQLVFRRPTENVRNRTDITRMAFEDLEAVVSSDRGLTVTSDIAMQVTWNGTVAAAGDGEFTITDDLVLMPLLNPAGETDKNNIWNRMSYDDGTNDYFSVRSVLRIGGYAFTDPAPPAADEKGGANNLKVEIFKITSSNPATPTLTVLGSTNPAGAFDPTFGPVLIRCQIADDDSHTWVDVVTEINTPTTTAELVEEWIFASVDSPVSATAAKVIAEQFLWERPGGAVTGTRGCDAQAYRLTSASLVSFFGGGTVLGEDDVLAINFGSRNERLARGGDTTIQSSELVIINRNEYDPPKTAAEFSEAGDANFLNAIPICKVVNGALFFINGAVFEKDATGNLAPDSTLRSDLAVESPTIDSGSEMIGSDVLGSGSPRDLNKGTVYTQLGEMVGHYNNHVNGNLDKHPISDITNRPFFVVNAAGEGDYTTIADGITAAAAAGGGTILVKNGSYDESITKTSLGGDIRIIGESREATIWFNSSGTPPLTLNYNLDSNVTIQNMRLEQQG